MINKVLLMEFFKDDDIKVVDKDFYIKSQMKSDVIKYITILEEENERLKEKCDYLQRSCDRKEEQRDDARMEYMEQEDYKTRCEKAIEYINKNILISFDKVGFKKDKVAGIVVDKLLNILYGGDE